VYVVFKLHRFVRVNKVVRFLHCGHYIYHQFNIHKFYVLPTEYIYLYFMDLGTNSDYFPIQH